MNNTAHYKIEFGFGVGKDRNQNPISDQMRTAAMDVIKAEAAKRFGAFTLTITDGGWTNPAGLLITEPGYTLSVMIRPLDNAFVAMQEAERIGQSFAQFICGVLEQEAVAIIITLVNFQIHFFNA